MKRVVRKMTKGWRMPPNTVYVGRPTQWGNGYRIGDDYLFVDELWARGPRGDRQIMNRPDVVNAYRQDLGLLTPAELAEYLAPLRGKDLACWCSLDEPCHADVLIELIGGEVESEPAEA